MNPSQTDRTLNKFLHKLGDRETRDGRGYGGGAMYRGDPSDTFDGYFLWGKMVSYNSV